jgi:two-component system, sensor histidine kinase
VINTSKRYILVVEDNCMITMILQVTLENMGVTAVIAENGKIGIEKFLNYVQQGYFIFYLTLTFSYRCLFEMIIMDILMPVMGGYDATKEIRKIEDQYKVAREDRHFICGFSADVSAGKLIISTINACIIVTT